MIMEAEQSKYRHEYKYMCNAMERAVLKTRVRGMMRPDSHADKNGAYRIRSLYFDTPEDACFYENQAGVDVRDKYRIRIYDGNAERITLEKKSKNRQMTLKQSCPIDEMLCRRLMSGEPIRITTDMTLQQKSLLSEMQGRCMRPVVIVEYLRFPFVEQNGNVRVTFDENISSSNDISRFLEPELIFRPILQKSMGVLEVKWDEFLPSYIKNHIQLESLQWSGFSKYYLCRQYNIYGGIRI
ncbi:MAG: polyphosphate polymerase domain-containing protein [Lachnospiraceae bacterium]|nr:polyphosphate polymerase domain-containing protein [Lachnospiraceae bacterium]